MASWTTSTFDANGNMPSQANGEGETRYLQYDASDNRIADRDPRSVGPCGRHVPDGVHL